MWNRQQQNKNKIVNTPFFAQQSPSGQASQGTSAATVERPLLNPTVQLNPSGGGGSCGPEMSSTSESNDRARPNNKLASGPTPSQSASGLGTQGGRKQKKICRGVKMIFLECLLSNWFLSATFGLESTFFPFDSASSNKEFHAAWFFWGLGLNKRSELGLRTGTEYDRTNFMARLMP